MLETIKEIATDAGKIIREAYLKPKSKVNFKGDIDLVTETDLASETYIISAIKKHFPDHSILSEESGIEQLANTYRWIIDPLDGTTNFAHRHPFCAVSIGVEYNGTMTFGVVYNPILDEVFWAEKGKGTYRNGRRITVSRTESLSTALLATGFPYDRWEHGDFYLEEYAALMKKSQGIRRAGAAAIDLCYLACGRLDGFFEHKLKPWDTAAGSLIVTEAGGAITQYNRNAWGVNSATILASNQRIHNEMAEILAKAHTLKGIDEY